MVRETRSLNEESGHDTKNLQTVIKITPSIDTIDMVAEGGTTIAECWNTSKQGRGQNQSYRTSLAPSKAISVELLSSAMVISMKTVRREVISMKTVRREVTDKRNEARRVAAGRAQK